MELEIGKKYLTKTGEVVGPLAGCADAKFPFLWLGDNEAPEDARSWSSNGKYLDGTRSSGYDIVAEYHEPVEDRQTTDEAFAELHQHENPRVDLVNHPPHYASGQIECIDAIQAQLTPEEFRGYLKGNVAKYLWRERQKGGAESLRKAEWYLRKLIELSS